MYIYLFIYLYTVCIYIYNKIYVYSPPLKPHGNFARSALKLRRGLAGWQGMGKRLGVRRFRKMSRAQKGIIALRLAPGDALASMHVVGAAAEGADASSAEALGDALLATANGLMQRVAIQDFPLFKGRQTRGNIVMRMKVRCACMCVGVNAATCVRMSVERGREVEGGRERNNARG